MKKLELGRERSVILCDSREQKNGIGNYREDFENTIKKYSEDWGSLEKVAS